MQSGGGIWGKKQGRQREDENGCILWLEEQG